MQTLAEKTNRRFDEFDLSDETFENYTRDWRNYVPFEVKKLWFILNNDERFLVALTADVAADIDNH
jgi:hypothetical protein